MKYNIKGFEIFFPAAIIYSIINIILWLFVYIFGFNLNFQKISIFQWHSHEMIYGYVSAVIAGYILTNIQKGINNNFSSYSIILFFLWFLARVSFCLGDSYIFYSMILDLSFNILLNLFVLFICIKTKQYKQTAVLSKLLFILSGNLLFYLGVFNILENGLYLSLYGGVYIVISLILTVGRKLIPTFINEELEEKEKVSSPRYLDILNLILFLTLFIYDLFILNKDIIFYLSLILFFINIYRIKNWYHRIIWNNPILWSIFLSFTFISIGFILVSFSIISNYPKSIAIHSFTFGGIALITMAMMARVIIENLSFDYKIIKNYLNYSFFIIVLGTIFRVIFPLFDINYYTVYIGISQILWIISFIIYLSGFIKIFIKRNHNN